MTEKELFESTAGDVITSIRHALQKLDQAEAQLSRLPALAPSLEAGIEIQMLNIPLGMARKSVQTLEHHASLYLTKIMREH